MDGIKRGVEWSGVECDNEMEAEQGDSTSASSSANGAKPAAAMSASFRRRAAAEARRRRILAEASERIGVVSGELPPTRLTNADVDEAEAEAVSPGGEVLQPFADNGSKAVAGDGVTAEGVVRDEEGNAEVDTSGQLNSTNAKAGDEETTSYDANKLSATSQRLQQMRKKRFRSKLQQQQQQQSSEESRGDQVSGGQSGAALEGTPSAALSETVSQDDGKKSPTLQEQEIFSKVGKEDSIHNKQVEDNGNQDEDEDEGNNDNDDDDDDNTPQYVGVAKMRRKLIAEQRKKRQVKDLKKQEKKEKTKIINSQNDVRNNEIEKDDKKKKSTFVATAAPTTTNRTTKRVMLITIPVLLELLLISCLFIAGLDVGMQTYWLNYNFNYKNNNNDAIWDTVTTTSTSNIYTRSSSRDDKTMFQFDLHGGYLFPFLNNDNVIGGGGGVDTKPESIIRKLGMDTLIQDDGTINTIDSAFSSEQDDTDNDEFKSGSITKEDENDDDDNGMEQSNEQQQPTKPLRREEDVLDQLYYIFLAVLNAIRRMAFFWRFQAPPVFFLVALTTRQIGRKLGAGIPTSMIDASGRRINKTGQQSSIPGNGFDIGGMIKRFFEATFPTMTKLYLLLTEARSDMYIVLTGWFVGLIAPLLWEEVKLWWLVQQQQQLQDTMVMPHFIELFRKKIFSGIHFLENPPDEL